MAFLYSATATKQYTASASAVVVVRGSNDIGGALTGDSVAKSKATQYKTLAVSKNVAEEALKIANIKANADAAAASVTVAVPTDTAQIEIKVTRPGATEAARLANAWVTALGNQVERMSTDQAVAGSGDSGGSVVSVKPFVVATKPQGPSSPRTVLNVALGVLVGLIVGLLWSIARMRADGRIRGTETLEKDFGLSVIGTLPRRAETSERAFLLDRVGQRVSKDDFRTVESFNEIRANLQFMRPDSPPRAIVVSSPLPSEGKSTVAANLAIAIAQSGRQVVLVDGDLRRPTVAGTFGALPEIGVTTAVTREAPAAELLQDVQGCPQLKVLTSGPVPPNPSEIVGSTAFSRIIEGLAETAFVIIDAPPLIPVSDGAIMARRFDGCLLVVDASSAQQDQLRKALSVLDKVDAEILGAVLNRVPTNKLESSRYGYYGDYAYDYSSKPETAVAPIRDRDGTDVGNADHEVRAAESSEGSVQAQASETSATSSVDLNEQASRSVRRRAREQVRAASEPPRRRRDRR